MLAHGLISPMMFMIAGSTTEQQKTKNNLTAKTAKQSRTQATLWLIIIASNIRAPPSINFIIEIEMIVNIIKKKANVILIVSIILIRILCMTMATNYLQGNKKKISPVKSNQTKQTRATLVLMITVLTTLASRKLA